MSKPTPGPWEIEDDASEHVVSRDPEGNEFHIVARAHGPDADANAALISAAPDLLAALKAMTDYMAYAEALGEDKAVFKNALAAIAKAEGVS